VNDFPVGQSRFIFYFVGLSFLRHDDDICRSNDTSIHQNNVVSTTYNDVIISYVPQPTCRVLKRRCLDVLMTPKTRLHQLISVPVCTSNIHPLYARLPIFLTKARESEID